MKDIIGKNIVKLGILKANVIPITFNDTEIKKNYRELKSLGYKSDIVFIDSRLILNFEHITGILKIINEEKKRSYKSDIRNLEIEFLLRICYTNQISDSLKINFGDPLNKNFIIIVISDDDKTLYNIENYVTRFGTRNDDLLKDEKYKRDYIFNLFFSQNPRDKNLKFIQDEEKFLKFLLERGAIAIK